MDPTNRNTAVATALVEELQRSGVRHAAISPGSRSSPLALALWRSPAISSTVHIDERSAGFWALGVGLSSGRPAVVCCTSGTAAANLHPSVCEADQGDVPLIVLTADRPPELRDVGAGQTIDQLKLYGSAVRWFCELGPLDADDAGLLHARQSACRAVATAAGDPRPGPVHVNVALREPLAPVPVPGQVEASDPLAVEGRGDEPLTRIGGHPPDPTPATLDRIARRLEGRRGVIVCGRLPGRGHEGPIVDLAGALGWPVLAEPTSQIRLGPHDRSPVICHYDLIARHRPSRLAPGVVLRFGDPPTSKQLRLWLESLTPLDQIVCGEGFREPTRRAATLLRGGPAELARGLAGRVGTAGPDGWQTAWTEADRTTARASAGTVEAHGAVCEPAIHRALSRLVHTGSVLAASSMPVRDLEAFWETGPNPVRFHANRGANGIDGTVSAAAGIAAATGQDVLCVLGDLALQHDMGGLRALVAAPAPVRLVAIDNEGGGIFELLPQASALSRDEFEAILGTPARLDLESLARAFDLPYHRVDDLDALGPALGAAGHAIIHLPVDRETAATLRRRIDEAVGAALAEGGPAG